MCWCLFQTIRRRSLTVYVSTVLTTCVRWWFSLVPVSSILSCHSTSETTPFTTRCVFTRPQSSSSHASSRRTIQNMTNRLVFCLCGFCLIFHLHYYYWATSQYYIDAAYCCRWSIVVCLSVTIVSPAKWLNQSRYRLEFGLEWAQGTMC